MNKIKTQRSLIDMHIGSLAKDSGSTAKELVATAKEHNSLQTKLNSSLSQYQGQQQNVESLEKQILDNSQETEQSKRNIFYLEGEYFQSME